MGSLFWFTEREGTNSLWAYRTLPFYNSRWEICIGCVYLPKSKRTYPLAVLNWATSCFIICHIFICSSFKKLRMAYKVLVLPCSIWSLIVLDRLGWERESGQPKITQWALMAKERFNTESLKSRLYTALASYMCSFFLLKHGNSIGFLLIHGELHRVFLIHDDSIGFSRQVGSELVCHCLFPQHDPGIPCKFPPKFYPGPISLCSQIWQDWISLGCPGQEHM